MIKKRTFSHKKMNEKQIKKISKFLSLILRHNPDKIGLQLDQNAWANVDELISKSANRHIRFTMQQLDTGAAFKGKLSCLDINTKEVWQSDEVYKLYSDEKGRN